MHENVAMRERIRAVEARCNQLEERMNAPMPDGPFFQHTEARLTELQTYVLRQ